MDIDAIEKQFWRFVIYRPELVPICGGVGAALMLCRALYLTTKSPHPEGWFCKTQTQWEAEVGLKPSEQVLARNLLKAAGFWKEELPEYGGPLFYRIHLECLDECIEWQLRPPVRRARKPRAPEVLSAEPEFACERWRMLLGYLLGDLQQRKLLDEGKVQRFREQIVNADVTREQAAELEEFFLDLLADAGPQLPDRGTDLPPPQEGSE